MKKTMTMPAMLVCLLFMISGFSNLATAQQRVSLAPSVFTTSPTGNKVPLTLQTDDQAIQTLKTELNTNYPAQLPSMNNAANAELVLQYRLAEATLTHIGKDGFPLGTAINVAFNEVSELALDANWSGLVSESWKQDLYTLLSL